MAAIAVADLSVAPTQIAVRLLAESGFLVEPVEVEAAASARVLLAGGFAVVDTTVLDRLTDLELVVRPGAGYERVVVGELRRRGVRLVAARLDADPSIAEWVMGAVIHIVRRFEAADRAVRAGDWVARPMLAGRSLASMTMGIIGVGRIGSQVAALSRAFGMRVLAWHPWSDRELGPGIQRTDSLDQLLASADVVSLHCRLEPETRGLIGKRELALMKPEAILVNTGRGGLVDERALARALSRGSILGAAIDTFSSEPHPERSPLAGEKRALLAPHLAGWTVDSVERLGRWAAVVVTTYLVRGELPADSLVV
jgi:D-3-phosphoglycerate dehydrogenase / 2-oxoglutarate reductase